VVLQELFGVNADVRATCQDSSRSRRTCSGGKSQASISGGLEASLLMHLGEEDEFISKAAQAEIKAALAKKPNVTVYSYPGQRHAFSRHNGAHYDAAAAALANRRTSEFLHQQLR
jgi:dienelactone hydrolase